MIERLRAAERVHVAAVYDVDERKRHGAAGFYDLEPDLAGPEAVIGHDDVDVVLVLTSMNEHGPLARAALEAGKHVLVEKPMATSLEEAAGLLGLSERSEGLLVCAPHILLSPTFRAIHAAVRPARSAGSSTRAPVTAGPARTGASGSTRPAAAPSSTSASTTSRACARSSGRRGA